LPEENAELAELIRKIALINAVKHEGKAQSAPVIGKLLAEKPELKPKVKEIASLVSKIVREVNSFSLTEQKRIVKEKWPETLVKEKVEEVRRLPPLPNVEKYARVVTRFSPNPDCVLHLGSARAIVLCYEYAHMYHGKFILRFEDTDPKLKRPVLEFYNRIREDLAWLGCKPDEEYIQSDRIPIYYEYAEKLLKDGKAYVCTCPPERFREKISAKKPCECRSLPPEEQLERWKRMLEGQYKEGEAVVRIKTDLNHPNPAVRDWPALRIIDAEKYPHPRVGNKYNVWPLYNFACGLDDHLMGVTHIIRGKEHYTNMVRQKYMYEYLGWQYPEAIHYGRLKIVGAFAALRRRGITPEAIRKLIIDVGPKTSDVVLSWENLYAYNRKILDPKSDRYFFVHNPVQLTVRGVPEKFTAKIRLHPENPERGFKEYIIEPRGKDKSVLFWISKKDVEQSKTGKIMRLMGLFNMKIEKANVGADMPCEVVMPDATVAEGIAESFCRKLKPGDVIQFERFGFVRIDKINRKLTAYYAHK